jgi:predicted  nucleic acid-binding Zn-ribbon protein
MWGRLREALGLVSDEDVDKLSHEIGEIRQAALDRDDWEAERADLEARIEDLESVSADVQDVVESNKEALSHLVEVLSHHVEEEDSVSAEDAIDGLEARLTALDDRMERLEQSLADLSDQDFIKNASSERPSRRLDGSDGRPSSSSGQAEGVERGKDLWEQATPAQRNIIKAMYDTGYPVSYSEISNEVGRSVSTVKNHINNLKSIGFNFKEDVGYNNSKKYMLDERVKTFLTLRLND